MTTLLLNDLGLNGKCIYKAIATKDIYIGNNMNSVLFFAERTLGKRCTYETIKKRIQVLKKDGVIIRKRILDTKHYAYYVAKGSPIYNVSEHINFEKEHVACFHLFGSKRACIVRFEVDTDMLANKFEVEVE